MSTHMQFLRIISDKLSMKTGGPVQNRLQY